MKFQIKNMVSIRCKMMLQILADKLGLHTIFIELGEMEIREELDNEGRANLKSALLEIGLEIIENRKMVLIEHIKKVVVEMVHHQDVWPKINFSNHLSDTMNYDYTYLANVFSETEHITIEQFVILHKVERVKELMDEGEMNITEIAFEMNYSSVGHLSSQFKKSTGYTPSKYKQMETEKRANIESLGNNVEFPLMRNLK